MTNRASAGSTTDPPVPTARQLGLADVLVLIDVIDGWERLGAAGCVIGEESASVWIRHGVTAQIFDEDTGDLLSAAALEAGRLFEPAGSPGFCRFFGTVEGVPMDRPVYLLALAEDPQGGGVSYSQTQMLRSQEAGARFL